jgi:predicted nucleotidyltransferase
MTTKPIIAYDFFKKLTELPFVKVITLYGSRARGDHQERSDIDLAISCPSASFQEWQTILDILENADTLLKIDCVKMEYLGEGSPLKDEILKQGVILYEQ